MSERKGLDGTIRHIPTRPASPGPIGGYPPARERELMAENKRLRAVRESWRHMSAYSLGRKKYQEGVRENPYAADDSLKISFQNGMNEEAELARLRAVLDAAAVWYETQLHTPLAPKMKARTALILAIKDYKAL